MISIFRWFRRLFSNRAENEYREELNYRTGLAGLRRQAEAMRRDAERARAEAHRLEVSGEHAAAVSKAIQAANSEKAYNTAIRTMLNCENTHSQAKTQKALVDLLNGCEAISRNVLADVDAHKAIQAQARLTQTATLMEEAKENMAAFQEGFAMAEHGAGGISAGEAALAEIMAAYEPAPASALPVQNVEPADVVVEASQQDAIAEPEEHGEDDGISHEEWLAKKRMELSAMA